MRSESDGHCWPTSFPGLAAREAARRRDLAPLVLSVCDRYRPTVAALPRPRRRAARRAAAGTRASGRARVERVRAVAGGFELDGHGVFRHVLLAPGHPGLAVPAELADDPRAVHAYEPHEYAARVAIVGAGMAAATEWLNALAAGAEVVSVRRREPARRPLNVARPFFTKRGLAGVPRGAARTACASSCASFGAPSYPPGRSWDEPLERAAREGRFRVERDLNGRRAGHLRDGLSARLRARPAARAASSPSTGSRPRSAGSCWPTTRPSRRSPTRRARSSLAGVPAQWAFPAADTLVGMKFAARSFRTRVERCPTR